MIIVWQHLESNKLGAVFFKVDMDNMLHHMEENHENEVCFLEEGDLVNEHLK